MATSSRVAALSLVFAAALMSGSAGAFASTAAILVHGKRITSIAVSSRALVWRSSAAPYHGGPGCEAVIHSRRWGDGSVRTVFRCKPRSEGDPYGEMAVGAGATVFTRQFLDFGGCCDSEFITHLRTAARAGIDSSDHFFGCGGDDIRGLAARGSVAAYGKLEWTSTSCPGNPDIGTETLTGGGVYTISLPAGQPRSLAGTPPPAFLALSTTRLAVVPYDLTNPPVNTPPAPLPEIQIWNLATRSLERTIPETGTIRALAMYRDQVVVVVGVNGRRIDRFSAATGLRTATRGVSSEIGPLAVAGRWIVYPVENTIRAFNTGSNRVRIIATPAHPVRQVLAVRGMAVWLAGTGTRIVAAPLS
jgi:hypothetical protein